MNEQFKLSVDKLGKYIDKSNNIVVIGHQSPDGYAVGSILAVYNFFTKKGKNIVPVLPDPMPEFLNWLPAANKVVDGENAIKHIKQADLIICIDFNEQKRVGELSDYLRNSNAVKILIDHHVEPENFAQVMFSYPTAGSSAEIVYRILKGLDKELLDKQIATCIFTGLITDTGCFCHDSAGYETFETAAELMKYDIDKQEIINHLYHSYSYDRMRLMGYVLEKKMQLTDQGKIAYITLTEDELKQFNYKSGDHENFVNLPLSIKTVQVSFFILENGDKIKISIRSKGKVDVNELARKFFAGGGHKKAAGGSWEGSMQSLINLLTNEVTQYINEKL